jgi:hypothetical protein
LRAYAWASDHISWTMARSKKLVMIPSLGGNSLS